MSMQSLIKPKKIILIIVVGLVVYSNAFFVPFIFDDSALISENPLIKQVWFLPQLFITRLSPQQQSARNFYRPVQAVLNMFDYHLWKENPFGFHLTNILLHIGCTIGLYYLFTQLFKKEHYAFLSALLFLVHPVNVEVVTYISGRADSLVLLFLLLSFINYVKFRTYSLKRFFCYSAFFYTVSLLSKEIALAGLFIFVLLDWVIDKKINYRYYSLFLALNILYFFLRFLIFGFPVLESKFNLFSRIITFLGTIFDYFKIVFFPVNLHMSYTWKVFTFINFLLLLKLASVSLLLVWFWWILRRQRKTFFFPLIWFFIFLIPQSGIIPINAFFAEHFIYLSVYGLFFIIISAGIEVFKASMKALFYAFFSISVLVLSLVTFNYSRVWTDPVKFYRRIISLSPGSFVAFNNLGIELERQGKISEARRQYRVAFLVNPNYAKAYYNFGRTYRLAGDFSAASQEYENAFKKAAEIMPRESSIYLELALLYRQIAKYEQAITELKKAIGLEPRNAQLYLNLGVIYKEKGLYREALGEYLKVLRLNPDLPQIYNNLGTLYVQIGHYKAALSCLSQALSLDSNYHQARFNLGLLYYEMGNFPQAIEELLKVPKDSPIFSQAQKQLKKIKSKKH